MSNKYIAEMQSILKEQGHYTANIDGLFGQYTLAAFKKAVGYTEPVETVTIPSKGLNETSIKRLQGVNTNLVKVVNRAVEITKQPFMVTEGLRTKERQAELVKKGASKTMNSKHLTGHAVDLAPIVNGTVSWDWQYFYPIADAMRTAAKELGIRVRWGGAWCVLNDTTADTKSIVLNYKGSFKDGPHFELI